MTDQYRKSGREVGPAILFFGCHSKDQDALYDSEMAEWESQGVVSVRYAFSQAPQDAKGAKHVQ
jgi:cytochrome P450/NADPH-cytochrome P450 reductase